MANEHEPRGDEGPSLGKQIRENLVTLLLGGVAAVAGVLALSMVRMLIALLCIAVILVWLLPFAPVIKERRVARFVLSGVLTAALIGAGIFVIFREPSSSKLAFEKVTGPVSPCSTFRGRGRIPEKKSLLVFDRQVTSNGVPVGTGGYYFNGPAARTEDGWIIRDVGIGKDVVAYDFYVEVTAGLVDAKVADVYASAHKVPESRINLALPEFDPGTKITMQVRRNKEKGGC
ncbi:hypothetical protein ACQP1W_17645 [Spirillospora sp. CA-255316]